MTRRQDTLDARAAADEWASERGLVASGGYSARWYRDGYLGGWWPDGWLRWWADYSAPAGSILGGDIVCHQFTSLPIDTNEMLESEVIVTDCTAYKDAIDHGVQRLWLELAKKTTLSKKIVREIAAELYAALQA